MEARGRWVFGYVKDGNDKPILNGQIKFNTNQKISYGGSTIVVPREFYTTTDTTIDDAPTDEWQKKAPGKFRIFLICDNDLANTVDYAMFVPLADNGPAVKENDAPLSLSYEDGAAKPIGDLLAESASSEDIAQRETLVSLIDARIALGGGINGGTP